MQTQATKSSDQAVETTLSLLQDLLGQDLPGSSQRRNFAVRLWDGTIWQLEPESAEPKSFTLVLQHPGALRNMFLPPSELNLGAQQGLYLAIPSGLLKNGHSRA